MFEYWKNTRNEREWKSGGFYAIGGGGTGGRCRGRRAPCPPHVRVSLPGCMTDKERQILLLVGNTICPCAWNTSTNLWMLGPMYTMALPWGDIPHVSRSGLSNSMRFERKHNGYWKAILWNHWYPMAALTWATTSLTLPRSTFSTARNKNRPWSE